METYFVSLEREGQWLKVGTIAGEDSSSAAFSYDQAYLNRPDAVAISLSLPLRKDAYSPAKTKAFFDGLLPEGFTRRAVAEWMRTDEDDYLAVLYGLGRECLGALRISKEGEEEESYYERLSLEQVQALAAEGATKSAELVTKSHLSLTGASGKVGLYLDGSGAAWYLPHGTAPSTHIVKQSHVRLRDIVTNEQLTQSVAALCGIDVPESFIVNTGKGSDAEVLLATRRFDRIFPENGRTELGLPVPIRLHQEDFAQAMGIPSSRKYEKTPEQGYLKGMFDLLRRYSVSPIEDQLRLWDRIVFDCLIGNTDAHLKNFSLIYGRDGRGIRLSPAYDLVSTCVYESSTQEMAFHIGGEYDIRKVSEDHFRAMARDVGLGEKMALRRLERIRKRLPSALAEAAEDLQSRGFERAGWLADRIREESYGRLLVSGRNLW